MSGFLALTLRLAFASKVAMRCSGGANFYNGCASVLSYAECLIERESRGKCLRNGALRNLFLVDERRRGAAFLRANRRRRHTAENRDEAEGEGADFMAYGGNLSLHQGSGRRGADCFDHFCARISFPEIARAAHSERPLAYLGRWQ
jgi:hypothetical protein